MALLGLLIVFIGYTLAASAKDCNKPDIKAETYHKGNDLKSYSDIKDADECFKKCKDYLGNHGRFCEGMTYDASRKVCYLHHTVNHHSIKTKANHFFAKNEKCPSSMTDK